MAIRYYDEAIVDKINKWFTSSKIKVIKPNETNRFFEMTAHTSKDKITLPLISISRDTSFSLLQNKKTSLSYNGVKLNSDKLTNKVSQLNAIPILITYQIDIFTQFFEDGDNLLRELIFNLVNKPTIKITIPYNGTDYEHIASIKLNSQITDNSDVDLKLFPDQFTRWTIVFEIQDAYLFSIPYNKTWKIEADLDE